MAPRISVSFLVCSMIMSSAVWSANGPPSGKDRVAAPIHYADQAVVVSTKEGVAAVRFTDATAAGDGRKYVYRFLGAGAAKEEAGEGEARRPGVAAPPRGRALTLDKCRLIAVAVE